MPDSSLDNLSYASCLEALNTKFQIQLRDAAAIELTLVEVNQHNSGDETAGSAKPATESLSLVLLGPAQPVLPQRIYGLSHEQFGELALFMVPIGRETNGIKYEVVINRFKRVAGG